MPVVSGELFPSDGVQGCVFNVYQVKGERDTYQVFLRSQASGELLDDAVLKSEEIGPWLIERQDW